MRADDARIAATIYYDGDCRLCAGTARRLEQVLSRRHLALRPLQTTGAATILGVSEEQLLEEVRLHLDDGSVLGGANAVVEIARRIWWAWPLWAMSRAPGVMPRLHHLYRWVARNRYCLSGACRQPLLAASQPRGLK
ncbi:MAG TPA: DUF393 domain-containing protein [Vicinamibacterales bacterium]|nr:DUF393 domain-containing protein [Vicinamibacterales bacterium]